MLLKLICCDVFARMACASVAASPNIVDLEFVPMLAHLEPDTLRETLQTKIDAAAKAKPYEKILLGFGLCGNATAGIKAPVPLILPRMHDCCTMFLGSKEAFAREFGHAPSTRWASSGYFERCYMDEKNDTMNLNIAYKTSQEYQELLENYGEENAEYVWETMHPNIETKDAVYIRIPEYEYSNSEALFGEHVQKMRKELRTTQGDASFFYQLVNGPWDSDRFLEVPAGESIVAVYDMDQVVKSSDDASGSC